MYDGFSKKENVNKKSAYLLGGLWGLVACITTMVVFALATFMLDIDRAYAVPFATISLALGSFLASKIASKKIGDNGYLHGLIVGVLVFITITIISLCVGNDFTMNTLFHFVIIVLASILGGILGVNSKKHKKYI